MVGRLCQTGWMSISENHSNRTAVGLQLLTAWTDPDATTLTQNSLLQISREGGIRGLVDAAMGLQDVAALLLIMYREETGKTMPVILDDLARKIQ
jgi:hypothetical protein